MGHLMSYNRVGRRWHHRMKGFRLNARRFSVCRLRTRLWYLFGVLSRWKSSYGQALESLKKGISSSSSSRRGLAMGGENLISRHRDCKLRSFGRSNSFYSEAIADCLEFIKRTSISVDEKPVPVGRR
uniref:Uncharacterized protein n=1 Tax=Nelumbo nucifera TaxID=4432 RepID=A0A822Z698_NELNU|nr:TPA_asm: hypothetical protein HUJ06_016217 [Nelumbo nucifera]